jgi:hypothetical protein
MSKKELTLAELVESRSAEQASLKILMGRIKEVRKSIREKNKQIQANLDTMVLTNSKELISDNNYGYGTVTANVITRNDDKE